MGTRGGLKYTGIRLYDFDSQLLNPGILDTENGDWSVPQAVPEGLRVVGFSCKPSQDVLFHLKFLLAKQGTTDVIDEIHFPPLQYYPTKSQFDRLYLPFREASTKFSNFRLSTIVYK